MRNSIIILCTLLSLPVFAQSTYKTAAFSAVVKGTSNLHNWQSETKQAKATASLGISGTELRSVESLVVDMPVRSIKSEKGSIMDGKTYKALAADKNPNITLRLVSAEVQGNLVNATCSLNIAGTTNTIDLAVKTKVNADGSVQFTGSKKIKMTDYKVNPPTALMGALTTGNDVEIFFNLTLKQ